jgi:hypothetical protein
MAVSIMSALPYPADAEWYLGGYGGVSSPSSLKDAKLDTYGDRLAQQQFPYGLSSFPTGAQGTITSSFTSSDIGLKDSPIYGGKAGYFFVEEGYSWLGVELEAFTSTPTINSQTVTTNQEAFYNPFNPLGTQPGCSPPNPIQNCAQSIQNRSTLQLTESKLRLVTVAFNVVTRYPGKVFQPYVGVGAGGFYFTSSTGTFQGRQVVPGLNVEAGIKVLATEEWGFFVEGKYNYATITNFDPTYGLSAVYSAINFVAGVAYHF